MSMRFLVPLFIVVCLAMVFVVMSFSCSLVTMVSAMHGHNKSDCAQTLVMPGFITVRDEGALVVVMLVAIQWVSAAFFVRGSAGSNRWARLWQKGVLWKDALLHPTARNYVLVLLRRGIFHPKLFDVQFALGWSSMHHPVR